MGPVFFVIAIMGCDDAGTACTQQRMEPAKYETNAQCQAAVEGALTRSTDIDFPVVSASCLRLNSSFADRAPAKPSPRS